MQPSGSLDTAQVDHFMRNGWVLVEGPVTTKVVERLLDALMSDKDDALPPAGGHGGSSEYPYRWMGS